MKPHLLSLALLPWFLSLCFAADEPKTVPSTMTFLSHPPLRPLPAPSARPRGSGPGYFVDATKGSDTNKGTEAAPWQTIGHALSQLRAGDTLYLRGGIYYERAYVSLAGKTDAPITIRSYPGERAILDGSIREFSESPAQAWVPCADGVPGEYRSVRPHPNLRDVIGAFGDSLVGLQTYWHRMDLQATNELWLTVPPNNEGDNLKPVYLGPGLWYDRATSFIHVRLAHTHTGGPVESNYRGVTDPRQVPLIVAPFASVPLFLDKAEHVRLQDLVIRGGGFDTVVLHGAEHIEFDNVTIHCGTSGLRTRSSGPVRFHRSALRGNMPPWAFRLDTALLASPWERPGVVRRNVARLTNHTVLVMEGREESDLFYYPLNHDWDISYSDFSDGHDGLYLSGEDIFFHHNIVSDFHDDALYLSPPTPQASRNVRVYQNWIGRCLTAFGFGGNTVAGGKMYGTIETGGVFIYRNVVDMRQGINWFRATADKPAQMDFISGPFTTHGRAEFIIGPLAVYQNTIIAGGKGAGFMHRSLIHAPEMKLHERLVFNNLFVYTVPLPGINFYTQSAADFQLQCNGNLHWSSAAPNATTDEFLGAFRKSKLFEESQKAHPPGWEANSIVADPKFVRFEATGAAGSDLRLAEGSPAIRQGVVLPADLPDPLRPKDNAPPDIGALPSGSPPFQVGREAPAATKH